MAQIEALEEEERFEEDYNESPPPDIVAYSELRSCADLVRLYEDGDLEIQPDFQRDVVWPPTAQTRFIDSLVKQLPIPSLCFAYDYKAGKWIVIDGLQRISTIVKFLRGEDWRLSRLTDIDPALSGASAATLKASTGEPRKLYNRVQNQPLPINVLRCDFSKKSHNEYLFTIFHRLNSGGVKLNNQEIRNCIYLGPFNDLMKHLDTIREWRTINHMAPNNNYRFTKQELILRFFAFKEERATYRGSVVKFLNDYMFSHRYEPAERLAERQAIFERVVKNVVDKVYPEGPAPRLPATIVEAILIGVAENIDHIEAVTADHARTLYDEFRSHESISEASLAEGLSKKDKVDARLAAAIEIFSK